MYCMHGRNSTSRPSIPSRAPVCLSVSIAQPSRMRSLIPHPLVLLLSGVCAAAVLTHVVRAGEFERRDDPATGRRAVVAGSFHPVPQNGVGPFAVLMALPQGMTEA